MQTITLATYHPFSDKIATNMFSRALPDFYQDQEIVKWEVFPGVNNTIKGLSSPEKAVMAHNLLDQTFLVFPRFLPFVHSVDRIIHRTTENPGTAGVVILYGKPGTGRKTAVRHTLSHFPQVILHSQFEGSLHPAIQIPWLFINTPTDQSLPGLRKTISQAITNALTPITNEFPLLSLRESEPEELLQLLHTSIIAVNLRFLGSSAAKIHALTDYLISITQNGCSVLLIATEEQQMLLSANLMDAMDLHSEAPIQFVGLEKGSFYNQWVQKLWNSLIVPGPELNSTIADNLLCSCYGNPALIIRSLKEAQIRALDLNKEKFSDDDLAAAIANNTAEMESLSDGENE